MMMQSTFGSWRRLAVLAAALAVLSSACASRDGKVPTGTSQPDKFLFERGTAELNKKKWIKAREYFRQLVDNYPQSQYRPDAKLGLGDTYLGEDTVESVILALNEFREYLTFYPTGRRNDYAQFKLGMAHYAQMLGPQRDQTPTKEAIKEFQTFVERFPNSPLIDEGRKRLRECKDRLAQSEYAVGVFYWRSRWYPGAVDRFKSILKEDPEFTSRDGLYYYLADSLVRLRLHAQAVPYLDKLFKEYQQSEFMEKAKKLMVEAQNPAPPKEPKKNDKKGEKGDKPEKADKTDKDESAKTSEKG